jgi:hypothetical protein
MIPRVLGIVNDDMPITSSNGRCKRSNTCNVFPYKAYSTQSAENDWADFDARDTLANRRDQAGGYNRGLGDAACVSRSTAICS